MESKHKYCIINASTGTHWYKRGTDRLLRSLNYHGFSGEVFTWDSFPLDGYDKTNPYNIKAAAFEYVLKEGFTHVLWVDCSVWAIKQAEPIFDIINDRGYYLIDNGYNCAQECNDFLLNHYKISRDEAESMKMISSGVMGINTNNPQGKSFVHEFIEAAKSSLFNGSREHGNQSKDSRFLHHRQDQSAASIIANKYGMLIEGMGESLVSYYSEKMREEVILSIRGL